MARSPHVRTSKIAWGFVGIYLAFSAYLIYQAFTCTGWLCDLVEFPAVIPFGLVYLLLLRLLNPLFAFGSVTYAPFENWFFIVPTLIGNSIIIYWLVVGVAKLRRPRK